jgi:hypothetical protein
MLLAEHLPKAEQEELIALAHNVRGVWRNLNGEYLERLVQNPALEREVLKLVEIAKANERPVPS